PTPAGEGRSLARRGFVQQQQPPPPPGVRKCGYLRKHKHGHRRFFVLRAPARLEYYESEKKWRSKSAAPKRSIALDSCLNIHKRADAKHKHLVALYTRDEYFALAAESEPEQEAWYVALTELLRESQPAGHDSPRRQPPSASREEPPLPGASPYREVWQVTLKPRGLGQSRNLAGVHRLCLAARTVGLVRLNCQRPCVTLQLMNIRRCGHSDSFFFMELGRSASTGPGELWMQADDSVVAQNIHETILEAMKALRELAEFRPRSKSHTLPAAAPPAPLAILLASWPLRSWVQPWTLQQLVTTATHLRLLLTCSWMATLPWSGDTFVVGPTYGRALEETRFPGSALTP
uniref:Insulin receptor substrate 2 n=1 Tax=Podarcis muralis TaxID=64176 RepID=A0A670I3L6_PODMU